MPLVPTHYEMAEWTIDHIGDLTKDQEIAVAQVQAILAVADAIRKVLTDSVIEYTLDLDKG